MSIDQELMSAASRILAGRGRKALEAAEKELLGDNRRSEILSEALRYFAEVTLHGALPSFPALLALSCEAVGGEAEKTVPIGAALTLLAGAADVHDDIIDRSTTKNSNLTVFGKYGESIALLAGDALMFKGVMLLNNACESLPSKQKNAVLNQTSLAFLEASKAEAMELKMRNTFKLPPREYLKIIRMKATVTESHAKIGAILGNGNKKNIKALGHFGRTFGTLSIIRDEFIDFFEYDELRNRLKNECPPLPILYALQEPKTKTKIMPLLQTPKLTRENVHKLSAMVSEASGVQKLKRKMDQLVADQIKNLAFIKDKKLRMTLEILLKASTEGV